MVTRPHDVTDLNTWRTSPNTGYVMAPLGLDGRQRVRTTYGYERGMFRALPGVGGRITATGHGA